MSSLSSGKLNDIKYLYENVVSGNQEVLGELNEKAPNDPIYNAEKGAVDFIRNLPNAKPIKIDGGNGKPTANQASTPAKSAPASTNTPSKFSRPQNAAPGISDIRGGKGNTVASTNAPSQFARSRNAAPGISDIRGGKGNIPTPATTPTTAPGAAGGGSAPGAKAAPARPVLSKQGGVEGTGTGANFKAGAWSSAEKSRYSAQAAKTTPAATPKPAIGVLGKTSFERRTPTSAELSGAQGAPAGSTPEQRLQAAQKKTFGPPTTGPTPAVPDRASISADLAKANANANRPAPAGSALFKQQALKPVTPTAAIAAAPSTSATASGGNAVTAANKIAAMNKQPEVKPQATISASYEYDAYDLVLEYLLDSGHAESIAEAQYIMTEMDQESIAEIAESQKPLPRNKMWNQIMNKPNKTGENLYSKNNRKMYSVIKAHDADPEGEAAKAKEKSKYKG